MVHGLETMAIKNAFAADGLIQLHWQKRDELQKTDMVAQGGGFASPEEMQEWLQEMLGKHKESCPEGWQPLVCDSTSDYFCWAKEDNTRPAA